MILMSARRGDEGVKMRVRYFGITDEISECGHCGRRGLKKTVMLFVLDADGNAEELSYFGTACAARALGTTAARVKRQAEDAERKRQAEIKRLKLWLSTPDITGRTLQMVRVKWNGAVRSVGTPEGVVMRGSVEVDGVTYGPSEGEGRGFIGFARAQEAAYQRELDALLAGR